MRTLALTLVCLIGLVALPVQAQSDSSATQQTPLWEVHLQLQKSFASPLGRRVMALVESEEPAKFQDFLKFAEAIGLDPRTDIGEVVLFGDGFDETDATVVASLGQSTGNLEGWILAAPGYESEDLDANTLLHSMMVDEMNARAWFALPKHSQSGNHVLVGSLDKGRTTRLAQQVLAGDASPAPNPLEGNSILSFFVHDLAAVPMEIDKDEPGSAIVKTIEQFGVNVASDPDNLNVALDISASSPGKARQISQLLIGIKALVQLAPLEEPEAQKVAQVLENLVVDHTEGQSNVHANLSAPYRLLEEIISDVN